MFIEPCCCHKQLPRMFRAATSPRDPAYSHGIVAFQTNGDITLQLLLNAVSSLIDEQPFALLLSHNHLTQSILDHIAHYYTRGWINALLLLDSAAQPLSDDAIQSLPAPLRLHSRIIHHEAERTSPLLACIGRRQALVITGQLESEVQPGIVTQHTAYLGTSQPLLLQFLAPTISRFRIMERGSNNVLDPRLDEIVAGHIFD